MITDSGSATGTSTIKRGLAQAAVAAVALLALTAYAQEGAGGGERRLVDGIAAVIGDEIILESEVDEELYLYQMRTGGRIPEDEMAAVRTQILREMVDETLLVAMARRDTIVLAEGELEAELERRVGALREQHGSQEALDRALAAEGLTIAELRDAYRDDIERRLLAEKAVRQEVHAKIDVTWREVENYYGEHAEEVARVPEAYEVAGILVTPKVSDEAKRSAIERMTRVRERLSAGDSFEDLAREFSEDASAEAGGDLGTFGRGMMVPEFEDAAFALEPGEVSGIVPTRFGFHIIEVLEKDQDAVHARHILARVEPGPEDEERARAKAESLKQVVLEGRDFEEVAREHSDDHVSGERGGTLGWFAPEEMAPEIRSIIEGLEPGGIGDVVRGDTGYYVIKLLTHESERIAPLDEVREDLREYIFGLKVREELAALIGRLSGELYVDIRTPTVSTE
jgi:peptidyl-prolyl cis-trans isomerase SurA